MHIVGLNTNGNLEIEPSAGFLPLEFNYSIHGPLQTLVDLHGVSPLYSICKLGSAPNHSIISIWPVASAKPRAVGLHSKMHPLLHANPVSIRFVTSVMTPPITFALIAQPTSSTNCWTANANVWTDTFPATIYACLVKVLQQGASPAPTMMKPMALEPTIQANLLALSAIIQPITSSTEHSARYARCPIAYNALIWLPAQLAWRITFPLWPSNAYAAMPLDAPTALTLIQTLARFATWRWATI